MARFLALAFGALWVVAGTAHAQAFKPRGGKPAAAPAKATSTDKSDDSDDTKPAKKAVAKKATAKKAVAKKAPAKDDDDDASSDDSDDKPAKASAKKSSSSTRASSKARGNKKSRAARDGRPDDLTPDPAGKHDPDFVVITDDDEIE
jgi:hypothetical protein